jgi:hypothetical protein
MSKSKYGDSNLYMTTKEFADLVITALEENNYFKKNDVSHPQDIAYAFSTVGETIGAVMNWAIKQEHEANKKLKEAVMSAGNLSKNTSGSWASASYSSEHVLPIDDEIAPSTIKSEDPLVSPKDALEYSEWKMRGYL